jgi:hypothetical protein
MSFSFCDWAREPVNAKAWQAIMQQSDTQVVDNPFDDPQANFMFGDAAFINMGTLALNKARRYGWTGFVDTIESIFEAYREMEVLGMLPGLRVASANPLM